MSSLYNADTVWLVSAISRCFQVEVISSGQDGLLVLEEVEYDAEMLAGVACTMEIMISQEDRTVQCNSDSYVMTMDQHYLMQGICAQHNYEWIG